MTLKNKRVVVTGASGFLGAEVIRLLGDARCEVLALSRNPQASRHGESWLPCDLRCRDQIENIRTWAKKDAVIVHLAASIPQAGQKKENVREAKENTLDPILNLLEVLSGTYNQFIYASTIDVYGEPSRNPYSEQEPVKPFTPYALAKLAGEIYCEADARAGKTILTTLRFSQIYGPQEPVVRVIPYIREALHKNKPFRLVTSGKELRRFVYVSDAAAAVVAALKAASPGIYNIAGPDTVSINELLAHFEVCAGRPLQLERATDPLKAFDNVPDISKAETGLKYSPVVDMRQGLARVWEAMQ